MKEVLRRTASNFANVAAFRLYTTCPATGWDGTAPAEWVEHGAQKRFCIEQHINSPTGLSVIVVRDTRVARVTWKSCLLCNWPGRKSFSRVAHVGPLS